LRGRPFGFAQGDSAGARSRNGEQETAPKKNAGVRGFGSWRTRGLKIKERKTPGDGRITKEIGNSEDLKGILKKALD